MWVLWVLGSIAVYGGIGLSLMKFFMNSAMQMHGDNLCTDGCCPKERVPGYDMLKQQKYHGNEFREERMQNCIMGEATFSSAIWPIAVFYHITQYTARGMYKGTRAKAVRLAQLEAEQAEREANVQKIVKELRNGDTDSEAFIRAFAEAPLVQVAPKGKRW